MHKNRKLTTQGWGEGEASEVLGPQEFKEVLIFKSMTHSVARVIVLKLKRTNHVTGLLITPVNLHWFGVEE